MTIFLITLGLFVLIGFIRFVAKENRLQNPSDMDILKQHKKLMNSDSVGDFNREMNRLNKMMENDKRK